MNYFEARTERLKANQIALIQLVNDVQKKDASIEAYSSGNDTYIQGIVFIKDESINSIHFLEVPYRWSGCGFGEHNNSNYGCENTSMPFTANDVISTFRPITSVNWNYKEKFKSKEQYLKWCSYLKKISRESFNPPVNN